MSIDPNAVGATAAPVERSWGYRDSLLYAVGIGAGAEDPVGSELEFTTNNSKGIEQRTFPTQGVVIGGSGGALGKVGGVRRAPPVDFRLSLRKVSVVSGIKAKGKTQSLKPSRRCP